MSASAYAKILHPVAMASAGDGSLYVGDFILVRKVTPEGRVCPSFAYGSGVLFLLPGSLAYRRIALLVRLRKEADPARSSRHRRLDPQPFVCIFSRRIG